jgi:hypothetical protein
LLVAAVVATFFIEVTGALAKDPGCHLASFLFELTGSLVEEAGGLSIGLYVVFSPKLKTYP